MFNNEVYFLEATKEFDEGKLDEALWSKVLSLNKGNEKKAKFEYIEQRAKAIQKEALFIKAKRILLRLILLVASGFVIWSIIYGIMVGVENRQDRVEREIRIEKEKAEELAYRNSLTGLLCRIFDSSYNPFYLIINDYKEEDKWGSDLGFVHWEKINRLKALYPTIRKSHSAYPFVQKGRRNYTTDMLRGLLTRGEQASDSRMDNFNINRDSLSFYISTNAGRYSSKTYEDTGFCSKITYAEINDIVLKAQKIADPDKLVR